MGTLALPRRLRHQGFTMAKGSDAQAKAAAKKVKQGGHKGERRVWNTTSFHRPRTLKHTRAPKVPRKSVVTQCRMDHFAVIKYPLTTESAMKRIEDNNTLVHRQHARHQAADPGGGQGHV